MSVVKLEQETLAILTELTDEEINGIVGGEKRFLDVEAKTKPTINVDAKPNTTNVQVIVQQGTSVAVAPNGNATAIVKNQATQKVINSR